MFQRVPSARSPRLSVLLLAIAIGLAGLLAPAAASAAQPGALSALTGPALCAADGGGDCTPTRGVGGPIQTAAFGADVYTVGDSGIAHLRRAAGAGGGLEQQAGPDGCVTASGGDGCRQGRRIGSPTAIAIDPDGRNVYVGTGADQAIAVFARDAATGGLTQLPDAAGCVTSGISTECGTARDLSHVRDLVVSPDGDQLYATTNAGAVLTFDRDRSAGATGGALTQKTGAAGCLTREGGDGCGVARHAGDATAIAISPTGDQVFVTAERPYWEEYWNRRDAVLVFNRGAGGVLTQLEDEEGCIANGSTADRCRPSGKGIYEPTDLVATADAVYVGSWAGVTVLRRANTGGLRQASGRFGCFSHDPNGTYRTDGCSRGRGLGNVQALAVDPGGQSLYAASADDDVVAAFTLRRDGTLRRLVSFESCTSHDGSDDDTDAPAGVCAQVPGLQIGAGHALVATADRVYAGARDSGRLYPLTRAAGRDPALPERQVWDVADDWVDGATTGHADDQYDHADVWTYARLDAAGTTPANRVAANRRLLTVPETVAGGSRVRRPGGDYWEYLGVADGRASLHPAGPVTVGWRNPTGQTISVAVDASVFDADVWGGDGIFWALDRERADGSIDPLGGATISSPYAQWAPASPYENTVTVEPGESLWLTVDALSNNSADGTWIDFRVTGPVDGGPQTRIISGPSGMDTRTAPPFTFRASTLAGADLPTATFECRLDGAAAYTACPAAYTPAALADGDHVLRVRAVDAGATDPTPAVRRWTTDATAPVTTFVSGVSGTTADRSPEFTFSSSADAEATSCRLTRDGTAGAWSRCDSPHRLRSLDDGEYRLEVRSRDVAGNVEQSPAARDFTVDTTPAGRPSGALTQLAGTKGCVSETGSGGDCADGRGLDGTIASVVVGDHLYAVGHEGSTLTTFERAADGSLTQLAGTDGCLAASATAGCAEARGMWNPSVVVASHDGRNLYVAAYGGRTILTLDRDPATGVVTMRGDASACLSDGATSPCATGRLLSGVSDLVVSPDDRRVYAVTEHDDTLLVLDRDAGDGTLSLAPGAEACVNSDGRGSCRTGRGFYDLRGLALSPQGDTLYVTGAVGWSAYGVLTFDVGADGIPRQLGGPQGCVVESSTAQGCESGRALTDTRDVLVSPDGAHVYAVANGNGVATFDRDQATGALTQKAGRDGCMTAHRAAGCERGIGLQGAMALTMDQDGRNLYVATESDESIAVLERADDGTLEQLAGLDACWSRDGDTPGSRSDQPGLCSAARGLVNTWGLALTLSPDDGVLYAAGREGDGLAVFRRAPVTARTDAPAMEWDAADDFPVTDRYGNTPWSYHSRDAGGDETALTASGAFAYWTRSRAGTDGDFQRTGVDADGQFVVHPGQAGARTVTRWTNPVAGGTFRLRAVIGHEPDASTCGDGVSWWIRSGGADLAAGTVSSASPGGRFMRRQTVERDVTVGAGESIEFGVDRRGSWDCDGTDFDIHLTGGPEDGPQTVITAGPSGTTTDRTPSFTFTTAASGATFACRTYQAGEATPPAFAPCASGDATPSLDEDGRFVFEVAATAAGTTDPTPARRTFTVDGTAPAMVIDAGPRGTIREASPTFTFHADDSRAAVECRLATREDDGTFTAGAWRPCLSPDRLPELAEDEYRYDLRATDVAGNTGAVLSRTFRVATGASTLPEGALAQLAGDAGCIANSTPLGGGATCTDGRALQDALSAATTSDGRFVYVAARGSDAVTAFTRDPATGALTQIPGPTGCVRESGTGDDCADGRGLYDAWGVAVSPDDRHVYVTARDGATLAVLERGADGGLTQLEGAAGCLRNDSDYEGCTPVTGLSSPEHLVVSADGAHVYVAAAGSHAVTVLDRAADGTLSQRAGVDRCWSNDGSGGACRDGRGLGRPAHLVLAPDGDHLYATAYDAAGIAAFAVQADGSLRQLDGPAGCVRDGGGDGCLGARYLGNPLGIDIAPDGRTVYATSEYQYAIAVFDVEGDGGLTQKPGREGCLRYDGWDGCADVAAIDAPTDVRVAPDGRFVYVSSRGANAIAVFERRNDGTLRQLSGADACWSDDGRGDNVAGRCRDGKALDVEYGRNILVPPDGRNVYLLGEGSDAIAAFGRRRPNAPTAPQKLTWDAAEDFRTAAPGANPAPDRYGHAGVWSYRAVPGAGDGADRDLAGATLLDRFRTDASWGASYPGPRWDRTGDDFPWAGLITAQERFGIHTASDRNVALQWRNPLDHELAVDVSGLVEDIDKGNYGDGVQWYVDGPSGELKNGTITPGVQAQFDFSEVVPEDGTLTLTLARRADNNNDGYLADVHITASDDEPWPQTTIYAGPQASTTDATPTFGVAASVAGATFECRVDDGTFGACPGIEPRDGTTATPTRAAFTLGTLSDGTHTLAVRALDGAAEDRTPVTRRFRVDSTAPDTAIDRGPSGLTRDATPAWSFSMVTAEPGTFECRIDDGGWAACTSPYTAAPLTDGTHTFAVRAKDRLGNVDAEPATRQLLVDTAPTGLQYGGIVQLAGTKGCLAEPATLDTGETCAPGRGLDGADGVVVSPDGAHVYAVSQHGDALTTYDRQADGTLVQKPGADGCLRNGATTEACGSARGLVDPEGIAITPDGRSVYVASSSSGYLAVLDRDPESGLLSQKAGAEGCIRHGSASDNGWGCATAHDLWGAFRLTATDENVYVAAYAEDAVAVFARSASGALEQLPGAAGCVRWNATSGCRPARALDDPLDVDLSDDGKFAYVASRYGHGVQAFAVEEDGSLTQLDGAAGCIREGGGEGCAAGRALSYTYTLDVVGDHIYAGADNSNGALAVLQRDPETGALSQATGPDGCLTGDGTGNDGGCQRARAMNGPRTVVAAPDGRTVLVGTYNDASVAVFRRSTTSGRLTQLSGQDACWSETGSGGLCREGAGLKIEWGESLAVAPDGASVYAASERSDALAVFARRLPRAADSSGLEWDAAADFDERAEAVNPSPDAQGNAGVWSYRAGNGGGDASPRDPATYPLLTGHDFGLGSRGHWFDPASNSSDVWKSSTRRLQMHPAAGPDHRPSVLRWTAPVEEPTEVQLSILLTDDANWCGNGVRWAVDHGTTELATGVLDASAPDQLDRSLTVAPGDTIDLVVANRGGDNGCDTTGVDFHVTAQPQDPEITEVPGLLTRDDTPRFAFRSDHPSATFQCAVTPGTTPAVDADFAACTSPHDLAHLDDGRHTFHVRTLLGGVPQRVARYQFRVDATAPAPTLTAPSGPTKQTAPVFRGTAGTLAGDADTSSADDNDVRLRVYADTDADGTLDDGEELVRDFTGARTTFAGAGLALQGGALGQGAYIAVAEQGDGAGNLGRSAARAFKVDTQAPAIAITSPANGSATGQARPTITGTAGGEDGTHPQRSRDDDRIDVVIHQTATASGTPIDDVSFHGTRAADGAFSVTMPAELPALPQGSYTVTARQGDAAGNGPTVSAARSFTVDTVAPAVTVTGFPSGLTRDRRPVFSGTAGAATNGVGRSADLPGIEVLLYRFHGTPSEELVRTFSGTRGEGDQWIITASSDVPDGTYTVVAEQRDGAGNVGRSIAPQTFKVDATAPQVTADTPQTATNDATPDLGGDAGTATGTEDDRSADRFPVDVRLFAGADTGGSPELTAEGTRVAGADRWKVTVPDALDDGTYTFDARQDDAAGNERTSTPHTFKVDDTAPAVTVGAPPAATKQRRPVLAGTGGTLDGTAADSVADLDTVHVRVVPTQAGPPTREFDVAVHADGTWSGAPDADLADGTYRVFAEQRDDLGNRTEVQSATTMKVDATGPSPTVGAVAAETREQRPQLTGTYARATGDEFASVADHSPVTVRVERTAGGTGAAVVRTFAATSEDGTWTARVPEGDELPDGTYRVTATQADDLGNEGTSAPRTFEVDHTAPAPALGDHVTPVADRTPTLLGTAGTDDGSAPDATADDDTVRLRLEGTSAGITGFDETYELDRTAGGAWTGVAADELADGTYRVTVSQSDAVGNVGTSAPGTLKVDDTDAVAAIIAAPAQTRDATPEISGTAGRLTSTPEHVADELTVALRAVRGGITRTGSASVDPATGAWSGTFDTTLDDGTWAVSARQVDTLGNGDWSAAQNVKVDTGAPAPALAQPTSPTNVAAVTFTGTRGTQAADEAHAADEAELVLTLDPRKAGQSTITETFDGDAAWSHAVTLPADGTYDVTLRQRDAVGNTTTTAARAVKLDTAAPVPAVDAPSPATTNDPTPLVSGDAGALADTDDHTADGAVTLQLRRKGTTAWTDVPATRTQARWTAEPPSALADGTYELRAQQVDAVGNRGTSTTIRTVKVDRTAPAPTVDGPELTNERRPVLTGQKGAQAADDDHADDDAHLTLVIRRVADDGVVETLEFDDQSGATWSKRLATSLADGRYTAQVTQADVLGNPATSAPLSFKVDATAPAPQVTTPSGPGASRSPQIGGTAGRATGAAADSSADAAGVTVGFRRAPDGAVTEKTAAVDPATGAWSATFGPVAEDGTYQARVTQTDAAGNSATSAWHSHKIDATGPVVEVDQPADTRALRPAITGHGGHTSGTGDDAVADEGVVRLTWIRLGPNATFASTASVDPATGAFTATAPQDLAEGRYRVVVNQRDTLNNAASPVAREFDVDRTAPAPALTQAPTLTNDPRPTVGGTASTADGAADGVVADDGTVDVTFTRAGSATVTLDDVPVSGGAWTATVPAGKALGDDGTWTVTVTQRDAVGNAADAARTFVLDTTKPVAEITGGPQSPTNDTTPAFTFTANEAGATFRCAVDGGTAAPCSSGDAIAAVGDGPHTFRVVALDQATNTSDEVTRSFVVDTDPPQTTIQSGPADGDVGNDDTPTFTFAADEDATFTCRVFKTGTTAPAFGPCPQGGTLAPLADGDWTFQVVATDSAGNADPDPAARTFSVERVAPVAQITGGPEGLTGDAAPAFTFGADEPSTYQCRLDTPAGDGAWQDCGSATRATTGTKSYTGLTAQGAYTFRVRAADRATNVSTPVTRTFTLDTVAPDTTLGEPPASPTDDATPTWTFGSADTGATFQCRIDGGAWSTCASPHTPDALTEGTHVFEVRARDAAGNADATAAQDTIKVDLTAPAVTLATVPPLQNTRTPAFSGTAGTVADSAAASADAVRVTLTIRRGGDVVQTKDVDRTGDAWTATADTLEDGTYTAVATQRDAAGNVGATAARTFTIDATAPAVAIDSDALTRDDTPQIAGTAGKAADDAPTVTVTVRPAGSDTVTQTHTATVGSGGRWTVDATHLDDGSYVLAARQDDTAGNTGTAGQELKVDTGAPEVTLDAVDSPTSDRRPVLTGTAGRVAADGSHAADRAQVTVTLHRGTSATGEQVGAPLTTDRDADTGRWTVQPAAPGLADGTYTAVAKQRDGADNEGVSDPVTFRVDGTAPAPTLDPVASPTNDRTPAITGTLATSEGDAATGTVVVAAGADREELAVTAGDDGGFTVDWGAKALPATAGRDWTVTVRQRDGAGNEGTSADRTLRLDTVAPDGTLTSGPAGTTQATDATFTFRGESGATVRCALDAASFGACAATSSHTLTGLGSGAHTFRVQVRDAAGNTTVLTREWTVDPAATTVGAGGDLPADEPVVLLAPSASAPLGLTVQTPAADPGVTVTRSPAGDTSPVGGFAIGTHQVVIGGLEPATAADPIRLVFDVATADLPAGTTAANLTLLRTNDDGTTDVAAECAAAGVAAPDPCVAQRDTPGAGRIRITVLTTHASTWRFAKDADAPVAEITDGPAGEIATTEATFTFRSEAGAELSCRLDAAAFAPCASPRRLTGLSEGAHRFEVRATDAAGNVGAAVGRSFTVRLPKAQPPAAPGPNPPATGAGATPPPQVASRTLTPAQLQAMAQRLLGRPGVRDTGMKLGAAKAYALGTTITLRRTAKRAPLVALVCPDTCRVIATQRITIRGRTFKLATQRLSYTGAGGGVIALRLDTKTAKALRSARSGRLRLALAVTDGAGRRATATRNIPVRVR